MNKFFKYFSLTTFLILSFILLNGCKNGKVLKDFKHNTPLIKEDIQKQGSTEIEKTVKMGPQPIEGDIVKLGKRKQISSENQKNYLLIPDEYSLLKQKVTFKFQNLDYKEALDLMAKTGEINILVGEEVAGSISAQLINVPWDKAFNALLDLKNYAADFDQPSSGISISSETRKPFCMCSLSTRSTSCIVLHRYQTPSG